MTSAACNELHPLRPDDWTSSGGSHEAEGLPGSVECAGYAHHVALLGDDVPAAVDETSRIEQDFPAILVQHDLAFSRGTLQPVAVDPSVAFGLTAAKNSDELGGRRPHRDLAATDATTQEHRHKPNADQGEPRRSNRLERAIHEYHVTCGDQRVQGVAAKALPGDTCLAGLTGLTRFACGAGDARGMFAGARARIGTSTSVPERMHGWRPPNFPRNSWSS